MCDMFLVPQRLEQNPHYRPPRWNWRGLGWPTTWTKRSPRDLAPWSWWRKTSCRWIPPLNRPSSVSVTTHLSLRKGSNTKPNGFAKIKLFIARNLDLQVTQNKGDNLQSYLPVMLCMCTFTLSNTIKSRGTVACWSQFCHIRQPVLLEHFCLNGHCQEEVCLIDYAGNQREILKKVVYYWRNDIKNSEWLSTGLYCCVSVGQVNYPKVLDEDSSDALSPEQPASQESQSSVPSPGESKMPETPSPAPAPPPQLPNTMLQVRYRTSNTAVYVCLA